LVAFFFFFFFGLGDVCFFPPCISFI
jgi:hypothetical protein